ncbi:hypothetical protein [Moraxella phage Mcat24]|uniref:Uncharacterized protein n=1 Tax=Moraxella catarrhalis TaxID=480 RepID=A0ABY0BM47_MORCA|nr:hypothetical protein [Moraxella phage Mcat19]AKI27844.1 hypothetical protein [Moraxella phage Mcat20]AKI27877.1 hypothetical protein [Moraxella phage Mcat21]AKI27922.1 hypothetical protein [Moraxella phage Mcat22]AKI27972.1 hypothetical protein [Moraxella phage Mcat23]AKI28033.1 hypothetical protein [Moraxella phage Mcat24]AKI28083.1 hypothetical protein [Moraxella phage Mcat25]AKI28135.1 hypothetical protein [Moraxella phage Mcat26]AKI28190.1 hypothetical protein [Moraxella phage Mcat27
MKLHSNLFTVKALAAGAACLAYGNTQFEFDATGLDWQY